MSSLRENLSRLSRPLLCVTCVLIGLGAGMAWERGIFQKEGIFSVNKVWSREGKVRGQGQTPPVGVASDVDFRLFWNVWQTLQERYYEQPLKEKDLLYGALQGLAAGTGDVYTTFFEPEDAAEFDQAIKGAFGGIGAEIGLKNEAIQIIAPLADTPAQRAGLLAGDIIAKIDGEDTVGLSVEKAVRKIRGKKGTNVVLSIYRSNGKKPLFDVTITRDIIHIVSVKTTPLVDGFVHVEISSFNADTAERFDHVLDDLLRQKSKGVILDMRNNPGGLLDQAQRVAAAWIGERVVAKERRQGKIFEELHGIGRARLEGMPTIVLLNQGSASASEIVAGALRDHGFATIVGTKSFGKGSVQEIREFEDGSALKVTIAEWVTPNEQTIHKTGLEPDVLVEQTPEDYEAKRDPVLETAIRILNGTATSTSRVQSNAATGTSRALAR